MRVGCWLSRWQRRGREGARRDALPVDRRARLVPHALTQAAVAKVPRRSRAIGMAWAAVADDACEWRRQTVSHGMPKVHRTAAVRRACRHRSLCRRVQESCAHATHDWWIGQLKRHARHERGADAMRPVVFDGAKQGAAATAADGARLRLWWRTGGAGLASEGALRRHLCSIALGVHPNPARVARGQR